MPTGFFKINRSIFNNWMWTQKPYDDLHAWIWLIANANFKPEQRVFRGQVITIQRGQLVTSYDSLAEEWGWDRKRVMRYTSRLKKAKMIETCGTWYGTTISLVNYDKWQGRGSADGTTYGTADGTADGTHYKNIKKYKEPQERAHAREGGAAAEWRRRKEANNDR